MEEVNGLKKRSSLLHAQYLDREGGDRTQQSFQIQNCSINFVCVCVCVFSECNCHGKAEECYFNQTVADLSLSLDIHGQYRGGGVCIGCRDNTTGINCQTCVAGFYRPTGVRHTCVHLCLISYSSQLSEY